MVHETYFTVSDPPYQTIDDTSADDFRKLVDLNLIGYYLVAKVFLKSINLLSFYYKYYALINDGKCI